MAAVAPPADKDNWTVASFSSYLTAQTPPFVSMAIKDMQAAGVKFDLEWTIDHVCYRCDSMDEYTHLTTVVLPHLGHLLVESIVGGRPIACFKLATPLVLPHCPSATVDVLEVPSPKPGSHYDSSLEHFEMVVPHNLDDFLRAQPASISWDLKAMKKAINRDARVAVGGGGGSVKFHEQTLESVIEMEKLADAAAGTATN
ncbi:Aste57867_15459 [Aphanomyces stellatus]|uniref:Aste57867_15459 protein n=1 Tax=Aphanomyces stellatus TaxID=120398 RepID=A0A485L448_9STRA|nr:hypothetical protein As57867_015403 [Aphanomyces stellatus]VFT92261.1 Aste57867_15459 [Aphanomyces stellatus]